VELTKEERARITDSKHKLQSVANSLTHIDSRKIPHFDAIEECLDSADESLKGALKLRPAPDDPKSNKKAVR
jgi:hypothetical protein